MPKAASYQLLLVEDDPLVAGVLRDILEAEYKVDCATSIGEASARLRTARIHLALVDSILPDGRGSELDQLARDMGTRVIHMSGHPDELSHLNACDGPYLQKPFSMSVLLNTLRQALQGAG
jgi:DNA-binding response OmpR family regulator